MKSEISTSALELAHIFKSNPTAIEDDLLSRGDQLLSFFESLETSMKSSEYDLLKKELFMMVLEDLATGAMTLKASVIGLTFHHGALHTFLSPFDLLPEGDVAFSVSLKNTDEIRKWRSGDLEDIPQDDINAALYRVIYELSKMGEQWLKNS